MAVVDGENTSQSRAVEVVIHFQADPGHGAAEHRPLAEPHHPAHLETGDHAGFQDNRGKCEVIVHQSAVPLGKSHAGHETRVKWFIAIIHFLGVTG
jgi:hypothetical protein